MRKTQTSHRPFIGVRSSKDGKSARLVVDDAPSGDPYPPVNEARCSNELLEHLEHLHETNDLFGKVAKYQSEGEWKKAPVTYSVDLAATRGSGRSYHPHPSVAVLPEGRRDEAGEMTLER